MTYIAKDVPSPEEQRMTFLPDDRMLVYGDKQAVKLYDVDHAHGCWGCEQTEESDWETIHCQCCKDQWKDG